MAPLARPNVYATHDSCTRTPGWLCFLWATSFVTFVWWMNLSNRSLVTHADLLRYPKTFQCSPYKSGKRRRRNIKSHNPDARLTSDEVQRANGSHSPSLEASRPLWPTTDKEMFDSASDWTVCTLAGDMDFASHKVVPKQLGLHRDTESSFKPAVTPLTSRINRLIPFRAPQSQIEPSHA